MKKVILICDFCGEEGHDPEVPNKDCIKALKDRIENLEKKENPVPYYTKPYYTKPSYLNDFVNKIPMNGVWY